jgi:lysophospholipase L1-like esterase
MSSFYSNNARRIFMPRILIYTGFLLMVFTAAGCLTETQNRKQPAETTVLPVFIPADDPAIVYEGRFDFTDPKAPAFAFPGVSIRIGFRGTGIDIIFNETTGNNYYNIIIDGKLHSVLRAEPGIVTHTGIRGLTRRKHVIEVFKRTEKNAAVFIGFNLETGENPFTPPDGTGRSIEFYGDSLTAGYGNEISVDDPSEYHFSWQNENNYMAYGAQTARHFGADYSAVCESGKGLFRNHGGDETNTIPQLYDRILPDNPGAPRWDFSRKIPDVVVINLGANDFISELNRKDLSPEDFDRQFRETYLEFIGNLRLAYGSETVIICVVGGILNEWYPPGTDSLNRTTRIITGLVEDLNLGGDHRIHCAFFKTTRPPYGEDFHPGPAGHRRFANELIPVIKRVMKW